MLTQQRAKIAQLIALTDVPLRWDQRRFTTTKKHARETERTAMSRSSGLVAALSDLGTDGAFESHGKVINESNMSNSSYQEDDARWCYVEHRVEVCVRWGDPQSSNIYILHRYTITHRRVFNIKSDYYIYYYNVIVCFMLVYVLYTQLVRVRGCVIITIYTAIMGCSRVFQVSNSLGLGRRLCMNVLLAMRILQDVLYTY